MHRNWIARVGLLGLATLVAGCAGPISPENADPPLYTIVTAGDDWARVSIPGFAGRSGFSFSTPPGFEKLPLQPIDSEAAVYSRADAILHYDFGPYSAAPSAEGTDVVKKRMRIGGRNAIVVSYRGSDGPWVVEAWWEDVSSGPGGPHHLLMIAEYVDPEDRPELLAAIYSVRFD